MDGMGSLSQRRVQQIVCTFAMLCSQLVRKKAVMVTQAFHDTSPGSVNHLMDEVRKVPELP